MVDDLLTCHKNIDGHLPRSILTLDRASIVRQPVCKPVNFSLMRASGKRRTEPRQTVVDDRNTIVGRPD